MNTANFRSTKAVFFDLDDTLCGYWDAAKLGLRLAFEQHCPAGHTPEEMLYQWAVAFREFCPHLKGSTWYDGYLKSGEPTRTELMRRTLDRVDIVNDTLAKTLSYAYMAERDRHLELFPDALEVIDELASRYPLGLITNGPADVQRQEIRSLGIESRFQTILIEGEMGEGKPNQSVFRCAESLCGFGPHEILFVGNSFHHDIVPALKAGWKCIWIRRPSDVAPSAENDAMPEEMPVGATPPNAIIGELRELLNLI